MKLIVHHHRVASFLLSAIALVFLISCGSKPSSADHFSVAERRAMLPEFEQSVWDPLATADLMPDERTYMEFVYSYLPLPDITMYPFDYWLGEVRSALKTRNEMGWNVPEREFRHFVLPTRVNNENLDAFRVTWADSLCRRVKGLSMYDAVLEINHWCHEQTTYKPSDGRTSSPLATVASGIGRCGEESVLGVAALRAIGIPARQVYVPRWAHTDDNHAWVEAWVDGTWYFLGACEPEPKLNLGWFNAPVSRAMLLHTRVFGDYHGDEDVIERSPVHTEINVIANYVPVRKNTVTVIDRQGRPVEGATVEFKIYNYAEFYSVATYKSDKNGQAMLNTGDGDMLVWASKDNLFGYGKLTAKKSADNEPAEDLSAEAIVTLNHEIGERFAADVDIIPPVENPIIPKITSEERAINQARLAFEDSLRLAHHPVPAGKATLDAFLGRYTSDPAMLVQAEALVGSLSDKDRRDVTLDVLVDAMDHGVRNRNSLVMEEVWSAYRECPRVENEQLRPFRTLIIPDSLPVFQSPMDIWSWTAGHIRLLEGYNPQRLRMAPSSVWQYRVADELGRNIFYVALCRAYGFEARINEVTGQTQYRWQDEWMTVSSGEKDQKGLGDESESYWLTATYVPKPYLPNPTYYTHFTLSSLNNGRMHLYNFEEGENSEQGTLASWQTLLRQPYKLAKGYYVLTSGTRLASGAVLAHMEFVNLGVSADENDTAKVDRNVVVPLVMRQAKANIAVLGNFDADPLLPYSGRGYYLLAVMGDRDEPSVHARGLLDGLTEDLKNWGRPVIELSPGKPMAQISVAGMASEKELTKRVVPAALARELCEGCSMHFDRLPVIVIADSFGRIVYFSQGYNTSLANDLQHILGGL